MLIRRRDVKVEPKPEPAREAPVRDERIDQLLAKIELLEKALAERPAPIPAEPDPRIDTVLEAVQNLPQAQVPSAPTSEWVFDVERGPYNEIKNVYARRVANL